MSKIVKNVKHLAKKKTKKELEEELALKEQTMDILADADTTPIAVDTASLPHYALAETVAAGAAVATDAAVATTATVSSSNDTYMGICSGWSSTAWWSRCSCRWRFVI